MPELPEVEIAARRLDAAAAGARVESAMAPGMVTMKTFDPPLDALAGATVERVRRRGKMFVVELGELALLIHLMSAGRLQLWDDRASLRDRASRLLVRLDDGRELRLREFGTQQRAWAKLLPAAEVEQDEAVATLGPEALPARRRTSRSCSTSPATCTRCCATSARSPASAARGSTRSSGRRGCRRSRRARSSSSDEVERIGEAIGSTLQGAIDHYEDVIGEKVPDKAADAAPGAPPGGRGLPQLRHHDRGDPLQGLRDVLLPARSRPGEGCSRTAGCLGC